MKKLLLLLLLPCHLLAQNAGRLDYSVTTTATPSAGLPAYSTRTTLATTGMPNCSTGSLPRTMGLADYSSFTVATPTTLQAAAHLTGRWPWRLFRRLVKSHTGATPIQIREQQLSDLLSSRAVKSG